MDTNPLVKSFLSEHPRHRYNVPFEDREKYPRFEDYVMLALDRVTDAQIMDLKTRFTFCERDSGVKTDLKSINLNRWTKHSYFTSRTGCSQTLFGSLSPDSSSILTLGTEYPPLVLAEKKVSVQTYHYYDAPVCFAGVIGEVICQLPLQFLEKTNDASYYILVENGASFADLDDMHVVTLTLYEQKQENK
jgi:hypothetical protein